MQRHKKFSSIGRDVDPRNPFITKIRKINKIVFHCTATRESEDLSAEDIDVMHRKRWGENSGCGYHFIIDIHGNVKKGRWSDSAGSHAGPDKRTGRPSSNADTIGVVYVGGVDKNLKALKEGMNPRQRTTAKILLSTLARGYNLKTEDIVGHGELPLVNKGCPCTGMDELREEIKIVNN